MTHNDVPFGARLKRAVLGEPDQPLVFLGNFEVEEQWARREATLPRLTSAGGAAVVNRLDEFALLLGGADDHVVVKSAPDDDHLHHLRSVGLSLPEIHPVAEQRPLRTVTEDALADDRMLSTLAALASGGAKLLPHGVSGVEETLSTAAGIPLAAPGAAVCKAVNSKVYSRRVADESGIRQPQGWACTNLAELDEACRAAAALLDAGRTVVVKEAFGVSGKGIAVVDRSRRLQRIQQIITAKAQSSGTDRAAFVIEEWVANRGDLNYQFTVSRDGDVHFDFVKTALTDGGVHQGHRVPADLPTRQVRLLEDTAFALGTRLAADGYFGVVGVDAIIDDRDELFPVIEINARNNMSTYQATLQERLLGDGRVALARHYPLRLDEALPFAAVRRGLGDLMLAAPDAEGAVVTNFATVNAGADAADEFDGRLYTFLVAGSPTRLQRLDAALGDRLDTLAVGAR